MAGIGFELKRLFRRKGLFATMRAYGYAGIVCTGPMLLGVLLQVGILVLCGLWGVGRANQDLLVCMVTYTLLASLTLTSFFSMPVTRFLADMLFADADFADADLLLIPGGMPGAKNIDEHEGVRHAVLRQAEAGRLVGAICAGPMVLGHLGLLRGRRATCYPGFEDQLEGAEYTAALCTVDGNIITGKGPGASFEYGYTLVTLLKGERVTEALKKGMMYEG